jgi:hypothetical protein
MKLLIDELELCFRALAGAFRLKAPCCYFLLVDHCEQFAFGITLIALSVPKVTSIEILAFFAPMSNFSDVFCSNSRMLPFLRKDTDQLSS